jgi:O-antigen/teichoic acid export membrane protein
MRTVTGIQPSLKHRAVAAGSWSALGFAGGQIPRLVSALVLTQLLSPDLYGLFAITTIVQTIFGLLSDVGLRQSVVQNPRGGDPDFLSTIWTLQVARGLFIWLFSSITGLAIFGLATAGQFEPESVYASSQLPWLLCATGAVTFVDSFYSIKALEQERNLNQRAINIIDLACQMIGLATTLLVAWYSRSVWAVVAGGMVQSVAHVALTHLFLAGHRVGFGWSRDIVREVVLMGRWIIISSSFSIFAMNADRILLSGWVTAETLGVYYLAFQLYMVISGAMDRLMGAVVFPMFSEAVRAGNERFQRLYSRIKLPYDAVLALGAGGLWASGEWIVRLLLDPRWLPAGEMLQILSLGLIVARVSLPHAAYMAHGKMRNLSVINAALLATTWVAIPLGYLFFGVNGAILAVALRLLPTLPIVYWFNRELGINRWNMEWISLLAWPVGYLLGKAVSHFGAGLEL